MKKEAPRWDRQPPLDCWGYGRATVTDWRKGYWQQAGSGKNRCYICGRWSCAAQIRHIMATTFDLRHGGYQVLYKKTTSTSIKKWVSHRECSIFHLVRLKGYIHLTLGSVFDFPPWTIENALRACLIIGYTPPVFFRFSSKNAILMTGGTSNFEGGFRWCTRGYSTVAWLQWWCAVIFCRFYCNFIPVTCDPCIVTQIKMTTIAQQWQMAAPPIAFPPTTCQDAAVASIWHSPRSPPQGGGLPSIAVCVRVRVSSLKNTAIYSVLSFERAPLSCFA
jgi:hypothetical protein